MNFRVPRLTLRTRLIAWSIVPSTTVLLALGLVAFSAYTTETQALIAERDWAGLVAASQRYGERLLGLLVISIVVPAVVVSIGIRMMTEPITNLIAAATEVAGGRFDYKIALHTGDELEELVKQFNLMSSR